jgi:hypothetical protein
LATSLCGYGRRQPRPKKFLPYGGHGILQAAVPQNMPALVWWATSSHPPVLGAAGWWNAVTFTHGALGCLRGAWRHHSTVCTSPSSTRRFPRQDLENGIMETSLWTRPLIEFGLRYWKVFQKSASQCSGRLPSPTEVEAELFKGLHRPRLDADGKRTLPIFVDIILARGRADVA